MQTNDHIIRDYDSVLNSTFGVPGTPERTQAEEQAYAFYAGQMLRDARKHANVTQAELAQRVNTPKQYISKIEHGNANPSVGMFYRILNALGMRIEIVQPIG